MSPSTQHSAVPNSMTVEHSHRGSNRQRPPAPAELPSRIEYLGDRRPPVPAGTQGNFTPPANRSRSSFGNVPRPGYYNPDDPSTWPDMQGQTLAQRRSLEQSSIVAPSSTGERGGTLSYTSPSPHTYASPGHSLTQTPPVPSISPYQQQNSPPLNMDPSFAGSVHTLPGFGSPSTPVTGPLPSVASRPLPAEPQTSPRKAAALLSSWGRRLKNGSDGSKSETLGHPGSTWTPHPTSQEAMPEFNPYGGS